MGIREIKSDAERERLAWLTDSRSTLQLVALFACFAATFSSVIFINDYNIQMYGERITMPIHSYTVTRKAQTSITVEHMHKLYNIDLVKAPKISGGVIELIYNERLDKVAEVRPISSLYEHAIINILLVCGAVYSVIRLIKEYKKKKRPEVLHKGIHY